MNPTPDELLKRSYEYIASFKHKAIVLREIHSNLAEICRKKDTRFTVGTIFFISLSAFLGFTGVDTIYAALNSISPPKVMPEATEFTLIFNGCTFIIFFISLLNLIFRWKENHTIHFQGVVRLTHFINWLDEQKTLARHFDEQLIKDISSKYAAIIDILPPNDTQDYKNAKHSLNLKSSNSTEVGCSKLCALIKKTFSLSHFQRSAYSHMEGELFFKELIYESPLILPLLRCMRDTDQRFWLGGGMIRNYIWDSITGRKTPIHDIDVIYFDDKNTSAITDSYYEGELNKRAQVKLRWSVKNQVRMYQNNDEGDVKNLYEAVANWPETATAIIIKLDECDNLQLMAPYGLQDLFSLNVKPTPFHEKNRAAYNRRVTSKNWKEHWPELSVML